MGQKKRTALVTGGSGFIGAHLVKTLLAKNYDVNLITRKNTDFWRLEKELKFLKINEVSFLDIESLTFLFKKIKPSYIFHLAAYGNYENEKDISKIIETDIIATKNLLEASLNIDYKCFVNTGSSSEYGFKKKPMKETDILEPVSFYAAAKASSTLLCSVFAKQFNKNIVTLRPFSVYGPWEKESRLIPVVIKSSLNDKTVLLTPGTVKRDFIYVEDIVNAYIKAAGTRKNFKGEVFNIGTGVQHSNKDIIRIVEKITGRRLKVQSGKFKKRYWDTDYWVADVNKTKKYLKWHPKYTLEDGLRETIKWYGNYLSNNDG